jgi:hypothetical protein
VSPGNEAGPRLGTEGAARIAAGDNTKSTAPTDNLAVTRADWDALLAQVAGPDDPTFRAASLLADSWGPALAAADRLGYARGYSDGYGAAELEMANAWRAVAGKVEKGLKATPTREVLAARRGEAG